MAYAMRHEINSVTGFIPNTGYITANGIVYLPKKNEFKRVDARLREWGKWVIKCITDGLGYPTQSTMVTAMQGSKSTAPRYPHDNSYAEEVHELVLAMARRHPDWEVVLKLEYTEPGTQIEKSSSIGLSRTKYNSILDKVKSYIEAGLK